MTKLADYSQVVTVAQLDAALRASSFDGVFHYLKGTPGFVLRVEDPAVVAGIRTLGWQQAGIDVPVNPGDADGAALAAIARSSYGFPAGARMYLDIEPGRFAVAPVAWSVTADGWCDAVRAGSFSPGIYGTDATVAACANRADTIWRARPGMCDPAGPGLDPAFFAGRRAVQCGKENPGVDFDVSYSEFPLGGNVLTPDDINAVADAVQARLFGPSGTASYLTSITQEIVNGVPVGANGVARQLPAILAAVKALQVPATQLQPVLDAIAALKADLDGLTLKRG